MSALFLALLGLLNFAILLSAGGNGNGWNFVAGVLCFVVAFLLDSAK